MNIEKIVALNKLTNKNCESRLIINSHMIHYIIPYVVIDSIQELIKCQKLVKHEILLVQVIIFRIKNLLEERARE